MKVAEPTQILTLTMFSLVGIYLLLLVPAALSYPRENSSSSFYHHFVSRVPRSLGDLFRRILGRQKNTIRTGFQGTNQVQNPYYADQTQYYPYPVQTVFSSVDPSQAGSYGYHVTGSNTPANMYQSSSEAGSGLYAAQVSNAYPSASYSHQTVTVPNSHGDIDFHSVLDQFIRSNGLAPNGDHASLPLSIQNKGDQPVFSFKKLYSFPFYLSTDSSESSGYNFNIPFMKKHIRRMSNEWGHKAQRKAALQQLQRRELRTISYQQYQALQERQFKKYLEQQQKRLAPRQAQQAYLNQYFNINKPDASTEDLIVKDKIDVAGYNKLKNVAYKTGVSKDVLSIPPVSSSVPILASPTASTAPNTVNDAKSSSSL